MLATTKTCRACGRGFTESEVFCSHDGSRLLGGNSTTGDRPIDPLTGSVLEGRYRILRVIGEGGMGIVYEGEHTLIERRVAVKVLRQDFCQRPDVVERFRREARSASRIGHPNIVDVIDFGETPSGASYFVMEMLQGEDLADVLARNGALPPARAALIAYQCCAALAAAHDKGIVHRDLKPENVYLIERDGAPDFVKVVDFGVAKMSDPAPSGPRKLTRSGMIFGTPEYMSPEQATGQRPDHRVDIYALGVTLYELLTGRVPFEGESFMSVLNKHASKQVPALRDVYPKLKISPELESVVFRALRKDRGERFQRMQDMADALRQTPEMPVLPFRVSAPAAARDSQPQPLEQIGAPPPPLGRPTPRAVSSTGAALRGLRAPSSTAKLTLAAAVLLCVAVAYATGEGGSAESVAARASTASAQEPHVATPAPQLPLAAVAAASEEPVALELVTVRVTTNPRGASVRLEGGGEVCEATPCAFEVVRGKPISLQARRGGRHATATLKPSGRTDLHLVLAAPGNASGTRAHDELKVPEMFRAER